MNFCAEIQRDRGGIEKMKSRNLKAMLLEPHLQHLLPLWVHSHRCRSFRHWKFMLHPIRM